MARPKVTHFVAVSDLSQAPDAQEGILLTVEGRSGNTARNRTQALEMLTQLWEDSEIPDHLFLDGISQDNLFFVPPVEDSNAMSDNATPELPPIVQGAQEIVQLTKLQIEAQDAARDAEPYLPIIQAVIDRARPLTNEEKALAKEKKYGKIIERFGAAIANQEEFQAQCSGNGKLVLNAIEWQLEQLKPIDSTADSEE